MNPLQEEIKQLIIDSLDLEDVQPAQIDPIAPLFVDGLGLDSIDALELGVAIKKKYNISFSAEDKNTRQHFASVATLADYVRNNLK